MRSEISLTRSEIVMESRERHRKEWEKKYRQTPQYKEYHRQHMRNYSQKPDVKERRKKRMKEYRQTSQYKEYLRQYRKERKAAEILLSMSKCSHTS